MSRIKRVGLSLVSALAAELAVDVFLTVTDRSGVNGLLAGAIGFSIFVIPGWLLSLPLVILLDRLDGWRLWVLAVYGTLLGPTIILALAIEDKLAEGTAMTYYLRWAELALVIAFLSTSLYLTVFKRSFRVSIEQAK